jgi:hypothetical protein
VTRRWPVLLLLLALAGCALERWTVPQPTVRTKELETVWTRLREAVTANCAGIETENTESQLLVGHWQAWSSPDGVYLTHCIATVLPEDERFADVRLTFIVKRCGTSSLDDLDELAKTCEPTDSIPQIVKDQLEIVTGHFEQAVRR